MSLCWLKVRTFSRSWSNVHKLLINLIQHMVKLLKQVVLIETKHEECISYYFIQIEFFLNEKSSAFLFYILILYSYFSERMSSLSSNESFLFFFKFFLDLKIWFWNIKSLQSWKLLCVGMLIILIACSRYSQWALLI